VISFFLEVYKRSHFISEVLKVFEEENGQFACSPSQTEGEIISFLDLYRASLIAFPGEKVMEKAQIFSSRYLKEAVQKTPVSSLSREVSSTDITYLLILTSYPFCLFHDLVLLSVFYCFNHLVCR